MDDRQKLIQLRDYQKQSVPFFPNNEAGEKARDRYYEKHYPDLSRTLYAEYHRSEREEYFSYILNKDFIRKSRTTLFTSKKFANDNEQLFYSVKYGYLNGITELLKRKPKIDLNILDGSSPLAWALYNNSNEIAKLLLKAGADKNFPEGEQSPLLWAVKGYNAEGVRLLIDNKVNVDQKDKLNHSALMWAALLCRKDIVEMLINAGANQELISDDGRTALNSACSELKPLF